MSSLVAPHQLATGESWEGGEGWSESEDLPSAPYLTTLRCERGREIGFGELGSPDFTVRSTAPSFMRLGVKITPLMPAFRCFAFGLLLFLSITVFAQEPPQLTATSEAVTITATKFAVPIDEANRQVIVIDSMTVARAAAGDLAQLLQEQASLQVNGAYGNPGLNKSLFTRGGSSQYILILLDGVPLTDPSAIGGAIDLRLVSLATIERIEIIRGPQSVLYGSDAVAGVINLITKQGSTERGLGLDATISGGSLDTWQGNAAIHFGSELLQVTVAGDYYDTGGTSEATPPAAPPNSPVFDEDGVTRRNVTSQLNYTPKSGWKLGLRTKVAEFDGDYDDGAFADGSNRYTNDLANLGLSLEREQEKMSYAGRYHFARTDRRFTSSFGEFDFFGRSHQTDTYLRYRASDKFSLLAGLQGRFEYLDQPVDTLENPSANTLSPYLQLSFRPIEALALEGGYRYTNHSVYGGQSTYSLALAARLTPLITLHTSLASAYLNPVLDQLFGAFGANPDLQPQTSVSTEINGVYQSENGRISLQLSLFERRIENIIDFDSNLGYQNGAERTDRGFDLALAAAVGTDFQVDLGFAYVDSKEELPNYRRPGTKTTFSLRYQPAFPLALRLTGQYIGERNDFFFDENFRQIDTRLDAYWLLNAFAEYRLRNGRYRAFADLRNLFDTDFVEVTGFSTLGLNIRLGVGIRL